MQASSSGTAGEAPYDADFYAQIDDEAQRSATAYARHLWSVHQPASVLDFGCGHGAWLKAFAELGSRKLTGLDGRWVSQADMADPAIRFRAVDLNEAALSGLGAERHDLLVSLEVLEHLEPEVSRQAVAALCASSDVILFGAAFLHQPGVQHINLRRHSFWAGLFAQHGYAVYDYFRPVFWNSPEVAYWYQQNTFLYVVEKHPLGEKLVNAGYPALQRLELMDAVHPELLEWHATRPPRQILRRALCRRLPPFLRKLAGCEE